MEYKAYSAESFMETAAGKRLSDDRREELLVVSRILPFRVNRYVVERLIDWSDPGSDPIFCMLFPNREMISPADYAEALASYRSGRLGTGDTLVREIRRRLNPHPSGQLTHNRPSLHGDLLEGIQHKYLETVLFFPSQGQTCHAYCSFCFRWAQFVGDKDLKMASHDREALYDYLDQHDAVTDLLITGGDPLVMRTSVLRFYLEPLLEGRCPHIKNVRVGTKALAFWPYRFTEGSEADELSRLFSELIAFGKSVAVMAHVSHPRELETEEAVNAIRRLRSLGVVLRSQAPLLRHVNDSPGVWADMWRRQVSLGIVPYYMFVERPTGANRYFALPLHRASDVFREAVVTVSGLARTVRGPVMSTLHGKVVVQGRTRAGNEDVLALRFLQARQPRWSYRPFFARFDDAAVWLDGLKPSFGETHFFFQQDETATVPHEPADRGAGATPWNL